MKNLQLLLSASAVALSLSACHNSPGAVAVGNWYNAFGQACGSTPYPGCDYFANGAQINYFSDPYAGMVIFRPGYGYCDFSGTSCELTWWSPTGIFYDPNGFALNDAGGDQGRDLIGAVARDEVRAVERTGHLFAARYGLAEDRAVEIVRNLGDWETLSRGRNRTQADLDEFTRRLYGVELVSATQALAAARQGDRAQVEQLSDQVARFWGTDPETARQVLKDWFREELAQAPSN